MGEAGVGGAVARSLSTLRKQGLIPQLSSPSGVLPSWPCVHPMGVGPWHQVFLVGLTSVTCGAAGCEGGGLRRTRQRRRAGGPELSRRRPGWETETKPARAGSREVHRDTRRAQEDGPCAQGTCVKLRGCPLCSGNLCPTS